MNLALWYYLITVAGSLHEIMIVINVFLIIFAIVSFLLISIFEDDMSEKIFKNMQFNVKKMFIILPITIGINIIIPSKESLLIIFGLNIGQKSVEKVINETKEFHPMLKEIIEKELKELNKDKEN